MPLQVSDEAPHCSMLDLPHSIPQHTTCNIPTSNLPICECTSQREFQAPIGQVVPPKHPNAPFKLNVLEPMNAQIQVQGTLHS